jgi:hypothetical protein
MPITITANFRDFPREIVTPEMMQELGLLAREAILKRTARGVDAEGKPFAPYSPGYAEQKRDALGTGGTPDLQVSGRMLNDLQIKSHGVDGKGNGFVELGFVS